VQVTFGLLLPLWSGVLLGLDVLDLLEFLDLGLFDAASENAVADKAEKRKEEEEN
jgi:hypothetical protein